MYEGVSDKELVVVKFLDTDTRGETEFEKVKIHFEKS